MSDMAKAEKALETAQEKLAAVRDEQASLGKEINALKKKRAATNPAYAKALDAVADAEKQISALRKAGNTVVDVGSANETQKAGS